MLIESAFDIRFQLAHPTPMIAMLQLHPSLASAIQAGNELLIEHRPSGIASGFGSRIQPTEYSDTFGNRCSRFVAPAGTLRLSGSNLIEMQNDPDPAPYDALQWSVEDLP